VVNQGNDGQLADSCQEFHLLASVEVFAKSSVCNFISTLHPNNGLQLFSAPVDNLDQTPIESRRHLIRTFITVTPGVIKNATH
jgi:hypothetical protein